METNALAHDVFRYERQCVCTELNLHEGRVATLAYKLAIAQQEREQCRARLEAMNQIGEPADDMAEEADSESLMLIET